VGIFKSSWEFFQVRQISLGTFVFQKSDTLRSHASVVKGMKALRFGSVEFSLSW
jgi:hypothetical protein